MKQLSGLLLLLILACGLGACEKEVNITLPASDPALVVNGFIEKDGPPILFLTHTIGFFSTVDLATLENSFVHGATVSVTDGSTVHNLREYSFDSAGHHLYVYTVDSADPTGFLFRGQTEHTYKLSITANGKTYESTTKIPSAQPLDSLSSGPPVIKRDKAPTALQLFGYYSDPDTPGNNVRYFTKRNRGAFYPGLNSVVDDGVINGSKNFRFPIALGDDRQGTTERTDSSGFVFPGDTIVLKWCAIDRGVYNFYNTLEYSLGTVGNPFSSPINVKSNVSNGALGVWAGYGVTYDTLFVK